MYSLGLKHCARKINNIYKDFKYTKSSNLIFYTKMSVYLIIHIAYNRNRLSVVQEYQYILVWWYWNSLVYKITNEKSAVFSKLFWIIPTFHDLFSIPNCHNTQTTYYLTKPILCHYLSKFICFRICLYHAC